MKFPFKRPAWLKLPELKLPKRVPKEAVAQESAPAQAAPVQERAPVEASAKPRLKIAVPRFTIGAKLVSLIAALLLTSIAGVGLISTTIMVQNDTSLIQVSNLNTAQVLAGQMRETFASATDKMRILGATLVQGSIAQPVKDRIASEFFAGDRDFLAVYVHAIEDSGSPTLLANASSPELAKLGDSDGTRTLKAVTEDKGFQLGQLAKGEAQLTAIKLPDGTTPALVIGVHFASSEPVEPPKKAAPAALLNAAPGLVGPISLARAKAFAAAVEAAQKPKIAAGAGHLITAVLRQSRVAETFSKVDGASVFMVDRRGKLLAHGDTNRVVAGENLAELEIVKMMREGKSPNGQKRDYIDRMPQRSPASPGSGGELQIGAYALVGFGGLGVVAQVPAATAFEGTNQVKYESALVAAVILCLSFLFGFLYSGTITRPIRRLVEAAGQISQGDFKINLIAKGKDEIAHLSNAFNDMAKGLEERDRVKETFNKFHNKEIAEKLLSGEVKLGGERKLATIFFSDIRAFTSMAEAMQPEQVVELLNEYMTRMVKIIRANGGVVDKYIGDAIMALWGVPIGTESDAMNAVKACLEMRMELVHLNAIRIQRGQPVLRIGMGLNTGEVIAGNIGSNEKMEYTVIGDTVNLGSRIESMTKEFGTDLLISQSVADRLGGHYLLETAGSAAVKGKTDAVEVFRVVGYTDEKGHSIRLETPYSSYKPDHSEKVQQVERAPAPNAPAHAPAPQAPAHAAELSNQLHDALAPMDLAPHDAMTLTPAAQIEEPSHASFIMETPMNSEPSRLIDASAFQAAIRATPPFAPAPAPVPAPMPTLMDAPEAVTETLTMPAPVPQFDERPPAPIHAPIDMPAELPQEASEIVRMNPEKPDDQNTRFSQFMGEQSPEASLANPVAPPEAKIDELAIDPEEKTGLLQMSTESMVPISSISDEPTSGFGLAAPAPAPDLKIQDATAAMESTYAGPPTPEAASGPKLEIKDEVTGAIEKNPAYEITSVTMPVVAEPAFGASLQENWYVRMGGEVMGPFTPEEIRKGIERKEFSSDSPMSSSPDGPWKRIDGYPQFAPAKAA